MLFYLSFCDLTLPEGSRFVGAAIIEADTEKAALGESWNRQINPGGEVAILRIPLEVEDQARRCLNRLIDRQELTRIFGPPMTAEEFASLEAHGHAVGVHPGCNRAV